MDFILMMMFLLGSIGLGMCFNPTLFVEAYEDIKYHPGLKLVSNVLLLLIAVLMISMHSVWVMGWPVILTILGYMLLAIAIFRFLFLDQWIDLIAPLIRPRVIRFIGIVCLIISVLLGFNL
ncbi:hypothetical protein OAT84_01305 [Gammaproteobacteria bacterium]|nr:hypothetical protein [Gammaproteobacteria bacterium]